ncbi:MAG: DNA-binding protein [Methanobrevibacter sp.]|nr:DNA-binding protein [Candidatus Methanovirga basalitermitum]
MTDLDELRQKRMAELQQQAIATENQEKMQQELEMQKKQVMIQILTPEARDRLNNLRLTKSDFVNQIELQLIQLAQSSAVKNKISDDQLKDLLKRVSGKKREINIRRK